MHQAGRKETHANLEMNSKMFREAPDEAGHRGAPLSHIWRRRTLVVSDFGRQTDVPPC